MLDIVSILSSQLGQAVAACSVLLYAIYKYKRVKAIIGSIVSALGTVGAVGATIVISGIVASTLGWVDPAVVWADVTRWAGEIWTAVGQDVVEWAGDRL